MNRAQSFPPLARPDATRLILGSMPGVASLKAQAYYAHPRNAFWPIMARLFGFSSALPYDARVRALLEAHVAVWDVLRQCVRPGSLDSAISDAEPNDFGQFLADHPAIRHIVFNGVAAEQWFRRLVAAPDLPAGLILLRAPSTSPAHAGQTIDMKAAQWSAALGLDGGIVFTPS
ncbi:DNA-deoxyinosine glycosylase [Ahniella affigens]|uniref:DNA-deoxyinosine glycosylase n=1 Tax=Ahniella affigens TaxID=2021234 RepID=A0A2P1PVK9_9GAMM|nr:DNA-deoxyinosine glycosylase [Ahniella affigens]AVP98879.1 DNA-deoxyinosine glycosylase [Ahniella affigens]